MFSLIDDPLISSGILDVDRTGAFDDTNFQNIFLFQNGIKQLKISYTHFNLHYPTQSMFVTLQNLTPFQVHVYFSHTTSKAIGG